MCLCGHVTPLSIAKDRHPPTQTHTFFTRHASSVDTSPHFCSSIHGTHDGIKKDLGHQTSRPLFLRHVSSPKLLRSSQSKRSQTWSPPSRFLLLPLHRPSGTHPHLLQRPGVRSPVRVCVSENVRVEGGTWRLWRWRFGGRRPLPSEDGAG